MPNHYSSKENEDKIKKAVKDGLITKKQVEKMPEGLVLGIIKKGGNKRKPAGDKKKK